MRPKTGESFKPVGSFFHSILCMLGFPAVPSVKHERTGTLNTELLT